MPTQRTLLGVIASLVVTLSFLIGYIAGQPAAQQSTVQALNKNAQVAKDSFVQTKKNDPVQRKTGSSYNSVYTQDDGVIYPAKSSADNETNLNMGKVAKKPKFVFRKVPKVKPAYSWRRKKVVIQNRRDKQQVEQGDGFYTQPQPVQQYARPSFRVREVQPRYYVPTPPQVGYGMPSPFMNNKYPMFPRTEGSYRPYGQ